EFRFYPETGVVWFSDPVYRLENDGYGDPEMYITTAFTVRSNLDFQEIRYVYDVSLGGVGIKPVDRSDIQRTIRAVYPTGGTTVSSVVDNQESVDLACIAAAQAELAR